MKRFVVMALTLVLLLALAPAAVAADEKETQAAETLYGLGLFKGTGTNRDGTPIYNLGAVPTRNQAIIMLVRLLGKEEEALAGTWEIPFTDVADSVRPYIGYAYNHGLTSGTTATTYSGGNPIRFNQYITFVLRALGYTSGEDFQVSTAWEFSDAIGLTKGEYSASTAKFTRGDVAEISCAALSVCIKGEDSVLVEQLLEEGAVEPGAVLMAGLMPGTETVTFDAPIEDVGCTIQRDALKEVFPKMKAWSYNESKSHAIYNIDTVIGRSDQMGSLLFLGDSHFRGSASFRAIFDDPNQRYDSSIELLVFDGRNNLCAFAVGTPVTLMEERVCRFTFVTCDYDFRHVYEICKEEFASIPYVEPEEVPACGAENFFYTRSPLGGKSEDRFDLYYVWKYRGIAPKDSYFSYDISKFPLERVGGDDLSEWQTNYLLTTANGEILGYTRTEHRLGG